MITSDKSSSRQQTAPITRRALLTSGAATALAPLVPTFIPFIAKEQTGSAGLLTLTEIKARSELALNILVEHFEFDPKSVFAATASENYHGLVVTCDCPVKGGIAGCECDTHPLAGTLMTGGLSCGECVEWDEETLLETLQETIAWSEKPEGMTDDEWREAVAVAGVPPFDPVEWERWVKGDIAA